MGEVVEGRHSHAQHRTARNVRKIIKNGEVFDLEELLSPPEARPSSS